MMQLVTLKNKHNKSDSMKVRPVVAIIDNQFIIDDPDDFIYPHPYARDEIDQVYGEMPSGWVTKRYAEHTVTSFPEWADNEHFYGHLIDSYSPQDTKQSYEVLRRYTNSWLEEYAVVTYGSLQKAQEAVTNWYWSIEEHQRKSRGWEQHEEYGKAIPLSFDAIYQSSHAR